MANPDLTEATGGIVRQDLLDATKAQTVAGTVVDGVRRPELTQKQKELIVGSTGAAVNQELLDLSKAQAVAGTVVDGVRRPELTDDQRRRLAELYSKKP